MRAVRRLRLQQFGLACQRRFRYRERVTAADVSHDTRLDLIAHVLAERVRPELVLLFGSRARGTAREDSDFDLMLIMRDPEVVESSRKAADDALREQHISADVLGRSVEEYLRRQHDPGYMDWMIAREGIVLYTTGVVQPRSADRMRESDPGEDSLAMWLQRAASDIDVAEHLLTVPNPNADAICFHAHAAVEKWLKASIVIHSRVFPPKTHDLAKLLAMQPDEVSSNSALAAASAVLMALYPKARYPEAGMPSVIEAAEAVAAALTMKAIMSAHLPF